MPNEIHLSSFDCALDSPIVRGKVILLIGKITEFTQLFTGFCLKNLVESGLNSILIQFVLIEVDQKICLYKNLIINPIYIALSIVF